MRGFTRDGKFHPITRYKKVRKALDPITLTKKTKGVKMTTFQARPTSQFATTLKKDERTREGIHVTKEWENFIRESYPKAEWTIPPSYWKITPSDRGLGIELEEVLEDSEFRTFVSEPVIEQRSSDDTKFAWRELKIHANFTDFPELSRKFLRLYARDQAESTKNIYLKYGRFSDAKEVRRRDGYGISELLSPLNLFVKNVEEGKIKDKNGLKLSISQVQGLRPEGGYLNAVLGMTFGAEQRDDAKATGYYSGLVVKISGDDDPDLSDDHNTWAVIRRVIDDYHYEVIPDGGDANDSFVIRDEDVKGLVGDLQTDLIGIGEERHKEEVVPIIEKALSGA